MYNSFYQYNDLYNELYDSIRRILFPDIFQLKDDCLQDIEIAVYMEKTKKYAPQMSDDVKFKIESLEETINEKPESHIGKTMRGVRGRYDREIFDYYPFKEKSGWCEKYQQVLFSDRNVDIFSPKNDSKKEDISRYGYYKAKSINYELKSGMPEDRIMSEMTLGMGLTNCIFMHLKEIKTLTELNAYDEIIHDICRIPGVKMRISMADFLFNYLEGNKGNRNLDELHNKLISAIPEIDKAFSKCKEDMYLLCDKDEEFNILKEDIKEEWETSMFNNPYIERRIAEEREIEDIYKQYEEIKEYKEGNVPETIYHFKRFMSLLTNEKYMPDNVIINQYEEEEKKLMRDIKSTEKLNSQTKYAFLHKKVVFSLLEEIQKKKKR